MGSNEVIPANSGDIVIYQSASGTPEIECVFHGENMWLTQAHMGELYQISKKTISEHLNNIFNEGELDPESVVRKFRTTAADGKSYQVNYYPLEAVITGEIEKLFKEPNRLQEQIRKYMEAIDFGF